MGIITESLKKHRLMTFSVLAAVIIAAAASLLLAPQKKETTQTLARTVRKPMGPPPLPPATAPEEKEAPSSPTIPKSTAPKKEQGKGESKYTFFETIKGEQKAEEGIVTGIKEGKESQELEKETALQRRPTGGKNIGSSSIKSKYRLQVGAFRIKREAEKLAARLEAAGHKANISKVTIKGVVYYRVRISGFPDRQRAMQVAETLKKQKIIRDFLIIRK